MTNESHLSPTPFFFFLPCGWWRPRGASSAYLRIRRRQEMLNIPVWRFDRVAEQGLDVDPFQASDRLARPTIATRLPDRDNTFAAFADMPDGHIQASADANARGLG